MSKSLGNVISPDDIINGNKVRKFHSMYCIYRRETDVCNVVSINLAMELI